MSCFREEFEYFEQFAVMVLGVGIIGLIQDPHFFSFLEEIFEAHRFNLVIPALDWGGNVKVSR